MVNIKKEMSRKGRFLYEMKNYFKVIVIIIKKSYNVCGGGQIAEEFSKTKETKKVIGKYYHQFAECGR